MNTPNIHTPPFILALLFVALFNLGGCSKASNETLDDSATQNQTPSCALLVQKLGSLKGGHPLSESGKKIMIKQCEADPATKPAVECSVKNGAAFQSCFEAVQKIAYEQREAKKKTQKEELESARKSPLKPQNSDANNK